MEETCIWLKLEALHWIAFENRMKTVGSFFLVECEVIHLVNSKSMRICIIVITNKQVLQKALRYPTLNTS